MSTAVRTIEFAEFGETNFHPIAIAFMACMAILVFSRKRSTVVFAVLCVCVFMPQEQRIVIGGLDFNMLRLITIVAWIRILIRGEQHALKLGELDRYIILWVLSASLFYVLRIGPGGIVYRLGTSFDGLSAFFLIRVLVRTPSEVFAFWRSVAWIVVVLSPFLAYEATAHYNVFGFLDYAGIEHVDVRDGRARAQGPFGHPILMGTFGGASLPVFLGIIFGRKKQRLLFALACVAATIFVLASGSSGPVMAWAVGVLGWMMWGLRKHMRKFLWGAVGIAVILHFVREAPVWQLIGRLSSITGGTGYHRSRLIDAFIRNFSEWAFVGTDSTAHWGWGLQDTTNQYVMEGISGGFATLVLFLLILRICFVQLRVSRVALERGAGPTSLFALLAWGCSVSLSVHCVSFISVSYFGQMLQAFVFFLATVPALGRVKLHQKKKGDVVPQSVSASRPISATSV